MTKLVLPVTKVDDTDLGDVQAVTNAVGSVELPGGYYKIVPMGTNLLWKIGPTDVTVSTGSYLADGDQEIIFVPSDTSFPLNGEKLSFIRSANTTVDGQINITVINVREIPAQDARPYRLE